MQLFQNAPVLPQAPTLPPAGASSLARALMMPQYGGGGGGGFQAPQIPLSTLMQMQGQGQDQSLDASHAALQNAQPASPAVGALQPGMPSPGTPGQFGAFGQLLGGLFNSQGAAPAAGMGMYPTGQ